jgi:glycosyltransferase involved in cell wall biosynthesis
MSSPLVSIVTPVYNGDKYIVECIDSVLSQTYQNWEYIVVDNCSTDKTSEIVQQYVLQDKRIKVSVNDDFLDIIPNWNRSFDLISRESKYCKVVHADDWLFPECIERMVSLAQENPNVGIVGSYRLDENIVNLDGLPYPSTVVPGKEICRQFFRKENYLFGSPTSTLIPTREIFARKPFYNTRNLHADIESCLDILMDKDFGFIHQVLTFTRRHNESTTSFSKLYGTQFISQLDVTKRYASKIFSKREFRKVYNRFLGRYYGFVAKRLCEFDQFNSIGKKRKFYNFHLDGLKNIGVNFSWILLFRGIIINQLNRILLKLTVRQ